MERDAIMVRMAPTINSFMVTNYRTVAILCSTTVKFYCCTVLQTNYLTAATLCSTVVMFCCCMATNYRTHTMVQTMLRYPAAALSCRHFYVCAAQVLECAAGTYVLLSCCRVLQALMYCSDAALCCRHCCAAQLLHYAAKPCIYCFIPYGGK